VAVVGLGLVHLSFIGLIISTSINLCLTYLLLQRFGVVGVAWAQAVSAGIHLLIGIVVIRIALRRAFGHWPKDSLEKSFENNILETIWKV
jgi:Na+-driven multidrug efflux pump